MSQSRKSYKIFVKCKFCRKYFRRWIELRLHMKHAHLCDYSILELLHDFEVSKAEMQRLYESLIES